MSEIIHLLIFLKAQGLQLNDGHLKDKLKFYPEGDPSYFDSFS